MREVFKLIQLSYTLRSQGNYFVRGNVKVTDYGIQSIKFSAPKIRDLILDEIQHCGSLYKFKNFCKTWSPIDCPYRLFKTYSTSRLHLIKHHNEIKGIVHYKGKYFCSITSLFGKYFCNITLLFQFLQFFIFGYF